MYLCTYINAIINNPPQYTYVYTHVNLYPHKHIRTYIRMHVIIQSLKISVNFTDIRMYSAYYMYIFFMHVRTCLKPQKFILVKFPGYALCMYV